MKQTSIIFVLAFFFAQLYAQEPTTIAIIGCHNQHNPAPVIAHFAYKVKPQYTVWVGDNVYADTETDASHIAKQLAIMAAKDGFATLQEESKFMVTWDDHDYGLNNADKDYVFKEESKAIHREFWRLENDVPADQDGIYYAKLEKQANGKVVQFIMIDGRYNKEKPGRKADILGEAQWQWLDQQLHQPADIRFLVSGMQVVLNRPCRWEAWIKQGKSRKRLFDLIKHTQAKGVVFITGDQHYVEVLKMKKALPYDAYEIMAAGINKTEKPGWTSKRVAGPDLTVHSAPLIQIHWEGENPHLNFTVTDVENGKMTLDYDIPFSQIGL